MIKQQILEKAVELKQQSEEIEKQLEFVNEQINEMNKFSEKLNLLETNKEEEILAPIGRGVYIKAKREENEKLFVETGAGVVVRKTPKEAKKIVLGQVKKFEEAQGQLRTQLEDYASEFRKMIQEIEKSGAKD